MADTAARLAALEATVADLAARLDAVSTTQPAPTEPGSTGSGPTGPTPTDSPTPAAPAGLDLWVLDGLAQRVPNGAIAYAGAATVADGPVRWQWTVPTEPLLADDWSASADRMSALAHPVRLRLLQRVLNGTTKTADLSADPDLGTTGQLHHHLRTLVSAGWLQSRRRGEYHVPRERVVPLLVVITAATA